MKPTKGRIVLVTAPGLRPSGNSDIEHAAIVTKIWSETMINVVAMPDCSSPLAITSVAYADPPHETNTTWRWPPRE